MAARLFVRLNGWVDRHFAGVVLAIGVATVATIVRRAAVTPFWHDEIYTVLASRLSIPTLWTASRDGLDFAPPLNTMLTRAVHGLAGVGPVSTRVPALAGFMTAFVLVAVMARRRSNALVGIGAALIFCFTRANLYASEARGYGVMIGCFAAALFFWSEYAAGRSGRPALAGLALALAAGLWTHYYFVFAFLPIQCGEIVRQSRRGRIDLPFWMAMALTSLAAAPLWLLMRGSLAHAGTFWTRLQHPDTWTTYSTLLGTLVGSRFRAVAAGMAVLLLASAVLRRFRRTGRVVPAHDLAAGFACLAIPAAAVFIARTIGHDVFAPRYVMFATAGIALALSVAIWRLGSATGRVDVVVFAVLVSFFVRMAWRTFEPGRLVFTDPMAQHAALVARVEAGDLTVVTGGTAFVEMWYHTAPDRRDRLVYLADPAAELEQAGTDSIDRGYLALARWSDVGVQNAGAFLAAHRDFVLYDGGDFWVRARLRTLGATLFEIGRDERGTLYRVHIAPSASLQGAL